MMNYNKIGLWLKGYVDAIEDGESVTKEQLETLIARLEQMINIKEKESKVIPAEEEEEEDDDLPF